MALNLQQQSQSHRTDQGNSEGSLSNRLIPRHLLGLFLLPPEISLFTTLLLLSCDSRFPT